MATLTNSLHHGHVIPKNSKTEYSQTGQYAEQNTRLLSPQGENDNDIRNIKAGSDYINIGLDDQCEIFGYSRSLLRTTVTWMFIIITGGFLRLFFHWNPELMLKATHKQCCLSLATRILIVEHYKKYRRSFVKEVNIISADKIKYIDNYSALSSGISQVEKSQHELNDMTIDNDSPNFIKQNQNYITNCLIVPSMSGKMKYIQEIKWFSCKKNSYIWDPDKETFYRLQGLDLGYSTEEMHEHRGLSWLGQMQRRIVYGENSIQVPVTPVLHLLFLEVLNPFYIFQIFSVILWYVDEYVYYATVIVITSVLSVISEVYQMHQNQMTLRSTIQSSDVVEVIRDNGNIDAIPSEHLVPGDVLVIPPQGCVMHCDAVLLQGNTIVNESMLTGESVPVTKTPLPNKRGINFSEKEHSRHILFCGTNVIQTRFYGKEKVTAVVIRTGFLTSKGNLVRSIMYPPPVDFKFVQDAYKFIFFLVGIASFGFVYTVVTKAMRGLTVDAIAVDSLDLITIVVPPALPMAMTVGILYALARLKKNQIFCISPRSINISGVLNCICFDKTGTLTEDGLDMKGVIKMKEQSSELGELSYPTGNEIDHLTCGMATCHSITLINKNMIGDPLDLKMFESTGWTLEEPGQEDTNKYDMIIPSVVRPTSSNFDPTGNNEDISLEIGILRQFPFSSSLQRMSVVTRKISDSNFNLYCKGAPEMIASLSKPETVPVNFTSVLLSYTNEGYRVLALSWKALKLPYAKIQRISREEAETDLIFLGLLILENRLKTETTPVITQLKKANIRTVMVTGDNILTALSVGRECGLVDARSKVITVKTVSSEGCYKVTYESTSIPLKESDRDVNLEIEGQQYCFAIDGKSWAVINNQFPEILMRILVRGCVFARMNPDQKQQLISGLQQIGYYVGMCGDGANDCGALKLAHAGISLSEAEASVASPFTSKIANISCVPILIREGRTALVTSFGVFKYMATYSLTQFVSVMILYSIDSNLTDFQFLYIDLFLITIFAFFFGRTDSYNEDLAPRPPPSSLISAAPLLSILLHITVVIGFQSFGFFYVQSQPWFQQFNSTMSDDILAGHENYAVFCLSQFQYIILAVVFSKGAPYRKPLYTNRVLITSIVIMTAFSIYLTLYPSQYIINLFEMVFPPESVGSFFRWQIIILAVINSFLALFIEIFIVEYFLYTKLKLKLSKIKNSKKKYLFIEKEMRKEKNWPPVMDEKNQLLYSVHNQQGNGTASSVNSSGRNIISISEYHSSL